MPTLDWIGKKVILNHHREVPYHLLPADMKLSHGAAKTGSLISPISLISSYITKLSRELLVATNRPNRACQIYRQPARDGSGTRI